METDEQNVSQLQTFLLFPEYELTNPWTKNLLYRLDLRLDQHEADFAPLMAFPNW
jgi:hypothetical protein